MVRDIHGMRRRLPRDATRALSARTLDEPWETLTRLEPLYYLVDATRYGFTGYSDAPVWASLGGHRCRRCCSLRSRGLAVALVGRGWRLKP